MLMSAGLACTSADCSDMGVLQCRGGGGGGPALSLY